MLEIKTEKGLKYLLLRLKNNSNGFFLMVENAATDKAGHDNDIDGKIKGYKKKEKQA